MITRNSTLSLLTYGVLFLFLLFPYADYDWGWHYRYGEHLLKYGQLLREDIFSWTMPDYKWVNHSWLYDPILYLLFNNVGFFGLTLAGAFLSFLAFYFGIKQFSLSYWQKGMLAVFFVELTYGVIWEGLRSQVLALLFMSILMFILRWASENKKALIALPLLFLIWANFHGTFTLGLVILGIFLTSEYLVKFLKTTFKPNTKYESKYNLKWFLVSSLASIAVTFINPFTYRVYLETLKHSSNLWLTSVTEWRPTYCLMNNSPFTPLVDSWKNHPLNGVGFSLFKTASI